MKFGQIGIHSRLVVMAIAADTIQIEFGNGEDSSTSAIPAHSAAQAESRATPATIASIYSPFHETKRFPLAVKSLDPRGTSWQARAPTLPA